MPAGNQRGPAGRKRSTTSQKASTLKPSAAETTISSSKSMTSRAASIWRATSSGEAMSSLVSTRIFTAVLSATRSANPLVAATDGLRGVDEQRHDVHVGELGQGALVELAAERVLGLVQARRVDEYDLAPLAVEDAAHAPPRGLRHGRGNGHLLAQAGVEQRRLAGVGAPHKRHDPAAEALRHVGCRREAEGASRLDVIGRKHRVELVVGQVGEGIEIGHLVHRDAFPRSLESKHEVGAHEDDEAHDARRDGEGDDARRGDVLRALGERMELLGREVDDGLDRGVHQLGEDDHPDAQDDKHPGEPVDLEDEAPPPRRARPPGAGP